MLQSKLFPQTRREAPADADNISTALLIRGGFIHKLMAGVYTYQTLGLRVFKKIEGIIREEINATGAQEIFMPALQPKDLWERSGRWSKLKDDMYQFKDSSSRELGLAMTHEEVVLHLLEQTPMSYRDLPVMLYQFQEKFRNEPRAKSGLLRNREFIMKDLYSAHTDEESHSIYYERVKQAYANIFKRVEVPAILTLASGGIFTDGFSHEFQSPLEIGEDTIFISENGQIAFNDEVAGKAKDMPEFQGNLKQTKAVEVGNIFNMGPKYSKDMSIFYTDQQGQQQPYWFASYGIGLGRLMGVIAEHHHDERGMIWPKSVAPFDAHLIDITKTPEEKAMAQGLYQQLSDKDIDVLYDDREVSPGTKFADADLLGMPIRLVVSSKSIQAGGVELKYREKDEATVVPFDRLFDTLID